ncbi:MAG: hypothetical protein WKF48_11435 [Solirubrobacteraceae bacterium]
MEIEQVEDWIGSEARERSGEKLGKIDDIYYSGADPVAIGIRSGLAGRKHHAAALKGARFSRDGLRLAFAADDLISSDGGPLTSGQIAALSAHDERLRDMPPEQLEGWQQREQRRKEDEATRARADELEAEAQRRAHEEDQAASRVSDAEGTADEARREREQAEVQAAEARAAADRT